MDENANSVSPIFLIHNIIVFYRDITTLLYSWLNSEEIFI